MDKTKQRIKIAEACGWKPCGWRPIHSNHKPTDLALGGTEDWWRLADENTVARLEDLPDYLNDLNAMHEAENFLANEQLDHYRSWLPLHEWHLIKATAEQRAEAFLQTLGLWEDSE